LYRIHGGLCVQARTGLRKTGAAGPSDGGGNRGKRGCGVEIWPNFKRFFPTQKPRFGERLCFGYFPNSLLERLCFVSAWRQRWHWHDPNKSVFSRCRSFLACKVKQGVGGRRFAIRSKSFPPAAGPRRARPACPLRLIRSSAGIIPGSSACHRYGKGPFSHR